MKHVVTLAGALFCAALASFTASAQTPLVNHGDTWRWHKGNASLQANWKTVADAALDATWFSGPGGFGYSTDTPNETNQCRTILADMHNGYTTLYLRRQFQITSPVSATDHLLLTMDFDDGFIAWLDGNYLTNALVTGAPSEPAANAIASATHESSRGASTPVNQPVTYDLSLVGSRLGVGTHTLAIIGLNQSSGSTDLIQIADLAVGPPPTGTIATDTTWTAANSPYVVSNNIIVSGGATLTIEPGVTVLFNQGLGMTISGRLLAEGTAANRIIFTRNTGATTWSQLNFTANSTTSRIAHAEMDYFAAAAIEAAGTTLHLDSINWTNSTIAAVDLHNCSITLLNSYIPGGAGNEPVHFNGMPANGHALIKGCVFGAPRGYNDSIDFTGGNRPGPIPQFIDNIFLAAVDDCFDMDATDAHIEGNIFLNVKQDAQRDSSSNPITTGEGNGISELVICRNIFYNCEHTLLLKDNGAAVAQNNTIVHLTTNAIARTAAGNPIPPGIILFGEPWRGRPYGAGAIYEGNIAYDLDPAIQANPFPLFYPSNAFFLVSHSLTQGTNWPGAGNISSDPMFVNLAGPMTAANIRSNLALLAGSPCLGTGPNGLDMGALVPSGASLSGAPVGATTNTSATLKVAGPGIWAYKWRLNGGPWSPEISLVPQSVWNGQPFTSIMLSNAPPILLSNLADGSYTVEVIGRNSAGFWQDAGTAAAKTWMVQTSLPLFIEDVVRVGSTLLFTFNAQAGQSYSVLYRDALDASHPWTKLADIPIQAVTGPFTFTDTTATPTRRFYQIVTPAQP